jgi:hypothetical protein
VVGVVVDGLDFAGVFEDGEVEVDGLFGVVVEPEEGRDAWEAFERAHEFT